MEQQGIHRIAGQTMSLGLSDRRRRRGRRWRLIGRLVALMAIAGLLGATFWLGRRDARADIAEAEARTAELRDQLDQLQRRDAGQAAELTRARADLSALQARYAAEVPSGPMKPLVELLAQRLAAGVDPARVENLLTLVENKRDCEAPVSRRLVVHTPGAPVSPSNSVSVPDNSVVVTGEGAPARDADGSPQGWFDPAQPVTVRFTSIGGRVGEVSGTLPIYHRLVAGTSEHRFTLTSGGRGFLVVTSERCAFP